MISGQAGAQARSVAVAEVLAAAAQSNAFKTASQQIQTTYKAQIDQQESRGQTLQAELNVLVAKYNEEAKKTPQNQAALQAAAKAVRSEEHTSELQSLMRISYAVFCLKTKKHKTQENNKSVK